MTRVIVTGATGFIGRHLVECLLSDSTFEFNELICLTRQKSPRQWADARVRFVQTDLVSLNPEARELLRESAYVFHVAANAAVDSGKSGFRDNVTSTREIVAALVDSIVLQRLVFVSSIGAIDRASCALQMQPLVEGDQSHPRSEYGRGKFECEKLVRESGLPCTIVRPAWVYGAGMRSDSHIRSIFRLVRSKHPVAHINFPGRVSLTKVESLVRFLVACSKRQDALSKIYFFSTSPPYSIGQIIDTFNKSLHGESRFQLPIPRLVTRLLSLIGKLIPLKICILLFDFLICDSTAAQQLVPSAGELLDPETEIKDLSRVLSREEIDLATIPTVLVSGAASGIGRALSEILYHRGFNLILVDRDSEMLRAIGESLPGQQLRTIDLESPEALGNLCGDILTGDCKIQGLVNCAGRGLKTKFVEAPIAEQIGLMTVNIEALVQLSHAALTQFKQAQSSSGFVVNVSSSSAFQPLPYFSVYSASKAFVTQFSQSLAGEYQGTGIRVITVCPGGTATAFQRSAGVGTSAHEKLLSSSYVAAQIADAIEDSKSGFKVVGLRAKVMLILGRVLGPQGSVWLWRNLVLKMR